MKLAIQLVAAIGVGAVASLAIPSNVIDSTVSTAQALGDRVAQIKLADLNPLRAIFDWEKERIAKGETPEELGFHPSAVTAQPYSFASPGYDPQQVNGMYRGNGIYQNQKGVMPPDGPH